jgi:hypothetical protein
MTDPVLNSTLLEEAADYAIEHDKENANPDGVTWYQAYYRQVRDCGTTLCLAGIVCEMTGGRWANDIAMEEFLYADPADAEYTINYGIYTVVAAANRARRLLGLTLVESSYLFEEYDGADELRKRVKRVINGETRENR